MNVTSVTVKLRVKLGGMRKARRLPSVTLIRVWYVHKQSQYRMTGLATAFVQEAAGRGCSMAFLPECFNFIGRSPAETVAQAQPLTGPAMQRYQELARFATSAVWRLRHSCYEHWLRQGILCEQAA